LRAQCGAVKRNGERCTLPANGQHGLCWAHDPENAQKRRRGASRGGRAKASRVTKALHELLSDLTEDVIAGELDTGRGAVANQLISTRIRLLEFERRVKEAEEFEERLAALEARAGEGRRWHRSGT